MIDLEAEFEKHDDEFLKFEREESPRHPCPDVCAFLLLAELVPPERGCDMVSGADHDEIWLLTDPEKLAEVATSENIRTLVRCGVRYDGGVNSLAMFA